jgi:uncharacterized lipoprotein YmbA
VTGSFARGWAVAGATLFLWGCGTFTLPKVYVLGDPSQPIAGVADEATLPHIELKTVTVPDYLDTTDIVRRTGSNQVVMSATGQWGERLSLGVTRALAVDLARRLPDFVIESRGLFEPAQRLLVDVERFDIDEDGLCTLTARWRITSSDGAVQSNSERGTFIEATTSKTDAAAVFAMTSAIDQLSSQIAATVEASVGKSDPAKTPPRPVGAASRPPRPPLRPTPGS